MALGRHRLRHSTAPSAIRPGQASTEPSQQLDHRHRRMKDMSNNIITQTTFPTRA